MITFNSYTDFDLNQKKKHKDWLSFVIKNENFNQGDLAFVFCNDSYLLDLNLKFLNHDTLTDVITFNYNIGRQINGDICISCDRVAENAIKYKTVFSEEIARVMVHGVLHLCGYKDSTEQEKIEIRAKENFYLSELFNR
jgi:rRNA maturation RNase YbeY